MRARVWALHSGQYSANIRFTMSATNCGFTCGNGAYNGAWDMVSSACCDWRNWPFMASLTLAISLSALLFVFSYAKGSLTYKSFRDFIYICSVLFAAFLCTTYLSYRLDTYYRWANFSDWFDGRCLCYRPKPDCFDRKDGGTLATVLGGAFFMLLFGCM